MFRPGFMAADTHTHTQTHKERDTHVTNFSLLNMNRFINTQFTLCASVYIECACAY